MFLTWRRSFGREDQDSKNVMCTEKTERNAMKEFIMGRDVSTSNISNVEVSDKYTKW